MSGKIYLVAALALAVAPCFASPIFVSNFSFETIPGGVLPLTNCAAGCSYSTGAIPGWSLGRQFRPGATQTTYFTTLSDGITSAYSSGGTISQTVGATVVQGDVYTLLVDIGWRLDAAFTGTADFAGSTETLIPATTANRGAFSPFTVSYTGLAADVGQSITIELQSSGSQANFDNVRLDAVPEPASFLLIALKWRRSADGSNVPPDRKESPGFGSDTDIPAFLQHVFRSSTPPRYLANPASVS